MSLTRPIPKTVRDQLADDPYMRACCCADANCRGGIQWHHHHTSRGSRTDDPWGILPSCDWHHSHAFLRKVKKRMNEEMQYRKSYFETLGNDQV